ncbi:MAG: chemotaxis protein CheB [Pseudomonadota bacterium]
MDDSPKDVTSEVPRRVMGTVDPSFYLIGVGASAGGLNAIKQLIGQIPEGFSHSLVVIQHLSPDYKSLMSEILGRETSLTVREVEDDLEIRPGHIYLIPPKYNVVIQGTDADVNLQTADGVHPANLGLRFSLIQSSPRMQLNLPVDLFLHSLAEAVADRGIAIILSGTGSDGSRGLRAVKDRDGFVMVQDPETADFDGMPRAAITSGIVDVVTPPDQMVNELQRYIEMRASGIINVESLFEDAEDAYMELLRLISSVAEIDFTQYKEPTLKRRIARRLSLLGCRNVTEYLELAKKDANEVSIIYREFLVGVTNFFRDLPAWKALSANVLPDIFERGDVSTPVKIWSVGCSTGEEAYSIAMLCEKYRRENSITREFRVFATDVNENSIKVAKEGIYPQSVAEEIPDEFKEADFLTFQGGTFTVSQNLRRRVVFAPHNVLTDSPYINADLIVCRNLLIYLGPDMQGKVVAIFSYALRQNGYLFLGAAEFLALSKAGFEPISARNRLFQSINKPRRGLARAALDRQFDIPSFLPRLRRLPSRERHRVGSSLVNLLRATFEQLDVAVFVVDEGGAILETFGDYRKFVSMPEQAFSSNLLDLAPDPVRSLVTVLLRQAGSDGSAGRQGVSIPQSDDLAMMDIYCAQVEWDTITRAFAVILRPSQDAYGDRSSSRKVEFSNDDEQRSYVLSLESELDAMQDLLSTTVEDLGVSNEELQTTNEELVASNEELQANNEEMQSINEELHTVNSENVEKITQLAEAYADIENLLATSDLAIAVLDGHLCLRHFSAHFQEYVALSPSDIGRRLADFSTTFSSGEMHQLLDDADRANRLGTEHRRELRLTNGGWARARVSPFRKSDGEMSGVVISLVDATEVKLRKEELRIQRDRFDALLESEVDGYWDWDIARDEMFVSPSFEAMLGHASGDLVGSHRRLLAVVDPEDRPILERALADLTTSDKGDRINLELRYEARSGGPTWVRTRGRVVTRDSSGRPIRAVGAHMNIEDVKQREADISARAEEIRRFAFIAAHDLVQPINSIASSMDLLLEGIDDQIDAEDQTLVGFISNALGRVRTRINGILEYSRLEEDQMDFADVDLNVVIESCLQDLSQQIAESGATVTVDRLPHVHGVQSLIARVAQNLLTNAIKFRREGRVCRVHVTEVPAAPGFKSVAVRDNGIGIEPAYRDKVFELFSRLHSESAYEGSGLGLALSHRLVTMHGGTIRVEDGTDGGSAFVFTLPSVAS